MIHLKTAQEIAIMAEGGKKLAEILKELEKMVKPGITPQEIDRVAETLILNSGSLCSFKGYTADGEFADPYPTCTCICVNEDVVHCAPSDIPLKEGDIVSIDIGLIHNGYHSDMAKTFAVGTISKEAQKLIDATKKSLDLAIQKIKPGVMAGDIGAIVQKHIEDNGFGVVRELCGHGIGKALHEDPQILNYGKPGTGEKLLEGMVICVEPIVTMGDFHLKKSGLGYQTKDGSLAAHFEYTIAIMKDGCKVLTVC